MAVQQLSKELEELLLSLPEEDRAPQRALLEKHESLRGGYLRQADYDRKQNQLKTEFEEKTAKWQGWYDKNVTIFENTQQERDAALAKQTELEQQVKDIAAKAATEGDMDPVVLEKAIEARLDGREYVSKKELSKIVAEESQKLIDATIATKVKEFNEQTMPAWAGLTMTVGELHLEHRDEFKSPLDRAKLAEFMKTKNLNDPREAYNQFVQPLREEAKIKKAAEDATKAAEEKAETARVAAATGHLPGTSDALGLNDLGAVAMFQRRGSEKTDASGVPVDAKAGTGALAAAAAAELVAEGKV